MPLHYSLRYRVREFLRRLWDKSAEDEIFFMAGAIAFNVLVALVPLIILGVGLTGYVLSARFPDPTDAVLALFGDNLPLTGGGLDVVESLRGPVAGLVEQRTGFTVFGALFFIWVSTRLVASLRVVLRKIFDIEQQRSILRGKIFDVQAVIVGVVLVTLNLGVTVMVETGVSQGGGMLGLGASTLSWAERILGYVLALVSIWVLFLFAYRYLSSAPYPMVDGMGRSHFLGLALRGPEMGVLLVCDRSRELRLYVRKFGHRRGVVFLDLLRVDRVYSRGRSCPSVHHATSE